MPIAQMQRAQMQVAWTVLSAQEQAAVMRAAHQSAVGIASSLGMQVMSPAVHSAAAEVATRVQPYGDDWDYVADGPNAAFSAPKQAAAYALAQATLAAL